MNNFIKTITGAWVSIASIEMAEPLNDNQFRVLTPRGKFTVAAKDFYEVAGQHATAKTRKPSTVKK